MRIPMFVNRLLFVFVFLSLVVLAGCSRRNVLETVVITGTVIVDGQPMEDVTVIFDPLPPVTSAAVGSTDAKGAFKLSTPGGAYQKGAVVGSFTPLFSKDVPDFLDTANYQEFAEKYGRGRNPGMLHLLPVKYNDPKTCGFDPVTVEKGKKNHFEFELSTK